MATIPYAVLVSRPESLGGLRVEHLYQHRADAEQCADAYVTQLGLIAWAADFASPLAVARHADAWAVLDVYPPAPGRRPTLRTYPSPGAAEAALEGARLIRAPVRGGMPAQSSVPRFAPSGNGPCLSAAPDLGAAKASPPAP